MNEYVYVLRHYATFDGRARRHELWMFRLIHGLIQLALTALSLTALFVDVVSQPTPDPDSLSMLTIIAVSVQLLYVMATFIPNLAVTVRRLHDAGFSGWLVLLEFISLGIIVVVLNIIDSTPGANKWGTNPKGVPAPSAWT